MLTIFTAVVTYFLLTRQVFGCQMVNTIAWYSLFWYILFVIDDKKTKDDWNVQKSGELCKKDKRI